MQSRIESGEFFWGTNIEEIFRENKMKSLKLL